MRTIVSRDNALVKRLHGLAHSARDRRKLGQTLLDGVHLVETAFKTGSPVEALIVAEGALGRREVADLVAAAPEDTLTCSLAESLFAHVSPVETPSGVIGIIRIPEPPQGGVSESSMVILDGVQDPGNLGTILRTTAAAGIVDVLLSEGCAQAWSPRVLRAGMGAHFALRIHERVDVLAALAHFPGLKLATALMPGAKPLFSLDLDQPVAWIFGAEGQGVSAPLLEAADACVTIPMPGVAESLNVGAAAAVCLFEQARQRHYR